MLQSVTRKPKAELSAAVYEMLTGEDDGRVCRDIPESACHEQPRSFITHVVSLAATKTGDGLVDPKLVLSWVLAGLGAPAFIIGLLVPVREAGSLLPQLFTAAAIRRLPQRKWVWAAGSFVQGIAVAGMALAALTMDGAAAGWTIVGLLTVMALARSACSVSYKDVLGKTVSKATRGTATGTAGTVAAVLVLLYGVLLAMGVLEKTIPVVAGGMFVAAALWVFAAALFVSLAEESGAQEGGANALGKAVQQISLLWVDRQLARFVAVRGLLTATALAPPFLVSLSGNSGARALGELGAFVIASSLASVVSSYVWGRLSDKSSRRVLAFSGLIATGLFLVTAALSRYAEDVLAMPYVLPTLLFFLMISYQGVRLGRSTHLVDMAGSDQRASYTAISNTAIGILLVAGGIFGVIAQVAGVEALLLLFAIMCAGAFVLALGLENVQDEGA